jgi:DNA (cytosine-5)-methyltransferase 1
MNELALFAGAGGGLLASALLGIRTVCAVERDAHAASVLLARQNDGCLRPFPIWDDVRTFDGRAWRGVVDIVSGGFPCQVNSGASRGRRVAEDLWPEFLRIVADVAPGAVFAENVTRKAVDAAADDLEALGYTAHCIALSAADLGGDHLRKRYWALAYADPHGELRLRVDAKVAELSRVRPRVWETYADESRMADGVAHWVDRLEATGNGQVPCVAVAAFCALHASFRLTGNRRTASAP